MRQISFGEVVLKSVVVHTVTYFIMGIFALFVFDYATLFSADHMREFMRPLDHPMVAAGPLFQPLRGLLFGIAFYSVREAVFANPHGWLRMWLLLVTIGVFSTFGPAPGSIEGIIYTSWPLQQHIGLGLLEVGAQALLLSVVLYYWVVRRDLRWLRYTLLAGFVIVLLLSAAGLLYALQGGGA